MASDSPAPGSGLHRALVVDDDPAIRTVVSAGLTRAGFEVSSAEDGEAALLRILESHPDVVVSDVNMPRMDGMELLSQVRARPEIRETPILLLTSRTETSDLVRGLNHGADDYILKPFNMAELVARVKSKVDRPPVPMSASPRAKSRAAMSVTAFTSEAQRELTRAAQSGRAGVLASIGVHEADALAERLGAGAESQVWRELADLVRQEIGPLDLVGWARGELQCLMPETDQESAAILLRRIARKLAGHTFAAGSDLVRLTPVIGFAVFNGEPLAQVRERADQAVAEAMPHLDLEPVGWHEGLATTLPIRRRGSGWRRLLTAPLQLILALMLVLVVPFFVYVFTDKLGFNLTAIVYVVVVLALLATATLIWIETALARRREDPPEATAYPPAAAIIAAYLPNEAATIVETARAFLRVDYPASYEVLLAYNTPKDLAVEVTLREIADVDPRLRLIRVPNSTSKAQNVNYALDQTMADMIGIFDADHHPEPWAFTRAWRWLAAGNDVVQGHNLVRNGDQDAITKTVAVEFEMMYAVAHPGRARLHGFGLFGGSNGFWRANLLRQTRMHGSMLTEDIDSSMRVVQGGGRIVSDPSLISRELAPTSLIALWNQRMRWSQGWFEVSLRHIGLAIRSKQLSLRQKLGVVHLTLWREIYPWLSLQILPIVAFWIWRSGVSSVDWLVPVFVLTTAFTLSTGPMQVISGYRLSHPDIRRHKAWYWRYALLSVVIYDAFKNLVSIVAQLRHLRGQRQWRVTPR